MADTKISAAADIVSVVSTDMLPVARSGSTTAYHATMAEISTWANTNLPTASTTVLGASKVDGTTITIASGVISGASPYSGTPAMDGTANPGAATTFSRGDHIHPSDTTRAPLASPALTGSPTAPTVTPATDSSTKLATTAFVQSAMSAAGAGVSSWNTRTGAVTLNNADVVAVLAPSSTTPSMDGTAAVGTGTTWARADHIHPTDTTLAPLASPTFTGTPSLPTGTTAVTQAVGTSNTALATTAFAQAAAAPAFNDVGRNLIHNPVFTVQQRTGPWTTTSTYTADRWILGLVNDTVSASVVTLADADRAAIGDEQAQFCLQVVFTGSSTAGSLSDVGQRLENVRRFSGKTLTVSFWARATSGTPRLGVQLSENFGSGGSPSAPVSIALGATAALTTAWTRYTLSAAIPSIAGKVFGTTAGTDLFALNLWFSDQGNASGTGIGVQSGTIQLWGVQLELGTVATPLAKRDPADELSLCQRFYVASAIAGIAYQVAGQAFMVNVGLPVTMRATPTITLTDNGSANHGAISSAAISLGVLAIWASATATGTVNLQYTFTASADL